MTFSRRFFALLLFGTVSVNAAPLQVASDEWCPFNCKPADDKPGYVIELLQAIFAEEGIDYRVLPWKRAVLQIQRGETAAGIGATKDTAEAEKLQIGQESIGDISDCLFVPANSAVRYQGRADDLNSLNRVGVALGYTYSAGFAEWLDRPANKVKVFTASGDDPAAFNLRKLSAGALDGVIETEAVMNYMLLKNGLVKQFVSVGCDTPTPIYVAFGPNNIQSDTLVKQFDQGIAELRKTGRLAEILARYGLKDWKH